MLARGFVTPGEPDARYTATVGITVVYSAGGKTMRNDRVPKGTVG
jgi:hypothetical protein